MGLGEALFNPAQCQWGMVLGGEGGEAGMGAKADRNGCTLSIWWHRSSQGCLPHILSSTSKAPISTGAIGTGPRYVRDP